MNNQMTKSKKVVNINQAEKFKLNDITGTKIHIHPLDETYLASWAKSILGEKLDEEEEKEVIKLATRGLNLADTTSLINFFMETYITSVADSVHDNITRTEFLYYVLRKELDLTPEKLKEYEEEFKEEMTNRISELEEVLKEQAEEESKEEEESKDEVDE